MTSTCLNKGRIFLQKLKAKTPIPYSLFAPLVLFPKTTFLAPLKLY